MPGSPGSPAAGTPADGRSPASSPAGRRRNPGVVALLSLVSFGAYLWLWLWRTTAEAGRFDPTRKSGHGHAKLGIPVTLLGILAVAAGVSSGTVELLGLAGLLVMVGALAILVAQWRLWRFVGHHEKALDVPNPVNPTAMLLGIFAAGFLGRLLSTVAPIGFLVPTFVNLYIMYRVQKGLNRVWEAADSGYRSGGDRHRGAPPAAQVPDPERTGELGTHP